ncbi:MAG: DEAD/DEAH box helicase [Saprospiraceae bacterium]|nr:DEAD/DEAH box helicase [Saprospiraceae bacterium]
MDFTQLNLIKQIRQALSDAGYSLPTEIQSKAITPILDGKDILGSAQTGTGKTAAFAIPILQKLQTNPTQRRIRALVVTPTRELALQIEENFKAYAKYLNTRCVAIFGGVSQVKQVETLKKGVDVLIATPGRLLDLCQQGLADISKIEILVLDEADHMLDMGFVHDVKKILTKIPKQRQTLLFSATMPKTIQHLADNILNHPVKISVAPVSSAAESVDQSVFFVDKKEKTRLLVDLLINKSMTRTLVFTRTKHGADKLAKQLSKAGIFAAAIHGNKSQNARQRALEEFKLSKIRVLVATDIAARGIDIDELPYVVNYELPNVPETYVHRIGRTGRAGKEGVAISFCDDDQKDELKDIQKLLGFKIPIKTMVNLEKLIVQN